MNLRILIENISALMHCILIRGDQLTRKRAAGAQASMANCLTPAEQLRGLVPVVTDWHARQCLLCVSLHALYTCTDMYS